MSLPVNASCAGGATAFACTCDAAAFCCDDDDDCACLGRDGGDELFSFSWPLVAGWCSTMRAPGRALLGVARAYICPVKNSVPHEASGDSSPDDWYDADKEAEDESARPL
ncbi:hypothetical protein JL720_14450 [Aureococcus anophagefferens]|nr:hypothetical protein JL720_14450 [Aureococcus anophagefferens]